MAQDTQSKSPKKGVTDSAVTVVVILNGQEVPQKVNIRSVEVVKELNKIPYALITFKDGIPADQNFEESEKDMFKPGSEIELKAGFGTGNGKHFLKG